MQGPRREKGGEGGICCSVNEIPPYSVLASVRRHTSDHLELSPTSHTTVFTFWALVIYHFSRVVTGYLVGPYNCRNTCDWCRNEEVATVSTATPGITVADTTNVPQWKRRGVTTGSPAWKGSTVRWLRQ